MKDVLSPVEAEILNQVNSSQKQYLELYAKYFAKAQNPEKISMTEIDSHGFTIVYYEDSELREVRATFGTRIRHPSQVDQALFSMAKEAIDALDIKADVSYTSPGTEIPTLIQSVNWTVFFLFVGIVLVLCRIRISTNLGPWSSWIKDALKGNEGMDNMFIGICVAHFFESLFTLGICKYWGDLAWSETLVYMLLSFVGGISVIKGCAYRVSQIQRLKSIKKN